MKILFLSQLLPYPLDAGAKVRAYYTLRHLCREHSVLLLSFRRRSDTPRAIEHLRSFCADVITVPMRRSKALDAFHLVRSLARNEPFLIVRDWRREMAEAVREAMASRGPFDVVHSDQLWMAPFAQLARDAGGPRNAVRTVLDQHNAVFQIPQRMAQAEQSRVKRRLLLREARALARYEVRTCQRFDQVVFVSEEDRRALMLHGLEAGAPGRDTVIPISVDPRSTEPAEPGRRPFRITFMGGLHWPPNAAGVRWFETSVWPRIRGEAPEAVFTIVGNSTAATNKAADGGTIQYLGYVDNPRPILDETAVFVVPLLAGGGMRVKILDAWARGLPVVSTTIGAEGICVLNGSNILLADTATEFAEAVIRLVSNRSLAGGLGRQGRRTVEEHYDWRRVYRAWDRVYQCAYSS